jgi:hypothetical protein
MPVRMLAHRLECSEGRRIACALQGAVGSMGDHSYICWSWPCEDRGQARSDASKGKRGIHTRCRAHDCGTQRLDRDTMLLWLRLLNLRSATRCTLPQPTSA